jgi:WD40 repeat protein/type II secretory pathway pseudopilin PulG
VKPYPARANGFSLLELSVILMIIGVITGMGLYAGLGALESAKKAQTEVKMDAIEKAIMAYRLKYSRLPCPADPTKPYGDNLYGREAANPGECVGGAPALPVDHNSFYVLKGAVPVETLGLPDEFIQDGWGRLFTYHVQRNATQIDAFVDTKPNDQCVGVYAFDAAGTLRALVGTTQIGAPYALVSHGPNGHGAYLATGMRYSSGSVNVAELANCNCDSAGTTQPMDTYVYQMDYTVNPANPNDTFDDIVRFKPRWQMTNPADNAAPLTQAQLVWGHINYGGVLPNLRVSRKNCTGWTGSTMTGWPGPALAYNAIGGVEITQDNQYIFVYSDLAGENCGIYRVDGSVIAYQGNAVLPTTSCPTYDAANKTELSNNGYLAITTTAAPFIKLFRQSGNRFVALHESKLAPTLTAQPTVIAFGRNADYLFLSDANTYATLYSRRNDDTFVPITSLPAPVTPPDILGMTWGAPITAAAFSPDGQYFALGHSNWPTSITLWQITNTNTFTYIDPFFPPHDTGPYGTLDFSIAYVGALAFSPDSRYLAVGGAFNVPAPHNINDNLKILKLDWWQKITNVTITGTYLPVISNSITLLGFTPDGMNLVIGNDSPVGYAYALERLSPTSYFSPFGGMYPWQGPPQSRVTSFAIYH